MAKHKQPKIDPRISDALRDHALIKRWYEKPIGRQYLRQFSKVDGVMRETFRRLRLDGETEFPDYMLRVMREAETIAVTPEMHGLVEGLARGQSKDTLPPSMCYHELIAPCGFLHLPAPIYSKDIAKVSYPIRAMAWYVDPDRLYAAEEPQGAGRPMIATMLFSEPFDEDPARGMMKGPAISLLNFAHMNIAELHQPWGQLSDGGRGVISRNMPEHELVEYQLPARYMVLFWLVANQKLAGSDWHEGPRLGGISARIAREAKVVPRVRVITLRRERIRTEPDPGRPSREYSHRWTVRAYWNQYHVGPGGAETVWRLIAAHVRGPDDKPLIVKERAFDLRR